MERVSTPMTILVAAQIGGILGALALLALWPPANGTMLLVPIARGGGDRLAALAIRNGARLVGNGPLPASLLVDGDRARLAGTMRDAGVLILAGSAAMCGGAKS